MDVTLPTLLAETVVGGWRPGIGDPTVGGWATVAFSLAAAIACGGAAAAERRLAEGGGAIHPDFRKPGNSRASSTRGAAAGRRVLFWRTIAGGMVLLAINKQLDLQSLLPVFGRQIARERGWYEDRQVVQRAFIYGVAVAGAGLLILMAFLFRAVVIRRPLAPLGLVFLLVFVLVRASSFHNVDILLGSRVLGTSVNRLLEVGGIACVFASAVLCCLEARGSR